MKIAIVHDYLNQMGGAENIVRLIHRRWPQAPLFTSVFEPSKVDPVFGQADIRTSFIQRMPWVGRLFRAYLPLYPFAFESFDLRGYDVVLSTTTAWTKGILTDPGTCHVAYVNTPMRFAWRTFDFLDASEIPRPLVPLFHVMMHWLRIWDLAGQARTDAIIANSRNVAARVNKFYRRQCDILHPPVDTSRFQLREDPGKGYLVLSRLRRYKRLDVVIEAFNRLGRPLTIVGEGPDRGALEALAGPTITFAGRLGREALNEAVGGCRALVVPAEEDFGITPLEAAACGRPVVALGRGGALETVVPADGYPSWLVDAAERNSGRIAPTGVFFHQQSAESIIDAVERLECHTFDPTALRAHALRFDDRVFMERLEALVVSAWERHRDDFLRLGPVPGSPDSQPPGSNAR